MSLAPAINSLEELRDRPAVALLLSKLPQALLRARFDRQELTLWLSPEHHTAALRLLRDDPATSFAALTDLTAVDLFPDEPRFEVVYSLLSHQRHERIRVKVPVSGADPKLLSVTMLWSGASPFEREVFDLFGVRFQFHPDLRRIMMPEDWEGHPLRKDYPVEGYK